MTNLQPPPPTPDQTPFPAPAPAALQPPAPQPSAPQPPAPYFNTLAIVSLVLSFFVSVAAIITGHIALLQIRRTGERGRGLALAGVIIGYFGVLVGVITIISLVAGLALGAASGLHGRFEPVPAAPQPTATAAPAPDSGSGGSGSGGSGTDGSGDITFDAGRDLPQGTVPHISDGLLGDNLWKLTTPRAKGTWEYTSTDGLCTTTFHEGELGSELKATKGDDLATTDAYLASVTASKPDDVASYATDDYIGLGEPEGAVIVDTRRIAGTDSSGRPHATAARAFDALGQGVSIDVSCSERNATVTAYNHVLGETALLVN